MKSILIFALVFLFYTSSVQAYVGPGLGVGVIGAIIGVIGAILMALIGVFWYPLKRMFGKGDDDESIEEEDEDDNSNSESKSDSDEK